MGVWHGHGVVDQLYSWCKPCILFSCIAFFFVLFLPLQSASVNLDMYEHKDSGDSRSRVGRCSVTAVTTYIADFDEKFSFGDEILRMNALVDTFLESSAEHCFTMLTIKGGKEAFLSGGLDSRVQLLELSLPVHSLHVFKEKNFALESGKSDWAGRRSRG